jgi:serine/threonine-protein kinase
MTWKIELRRQALLALKIGSIGAALVVIAALSAYFTVRNTVSGGAVRVPDLTEMAVADAEALLRKSGLTLEEAAQRNDERVEAGRILAQDPPPGADIKERRKVKVVVSLGTRVSSIPDLRGGAARKAQITLQQQGLRLGDQVYVYNRRVAENMVVGQDPLPDAAPGTGKIALLISRGQPPRTWVMPDLTGRQETMVIAFLNRAGLRQGPVRRDPARPEPQGTVVAQTPAAGYPVHSGDLVTLTVAGEGSSGG